jgi:hypothetical protein
MSKSKLSRATSDGYWNATRTVICQYCSKIRAVENIYQRKPRIKCNDCHNKAGGYK